MSAFEEDNNFAGGAAKVVEFFRQRVLSGEFKVGDRLPPERDLCVLLGISRPSLREGMKVLSMLGVVDSQQGRGAFVSEASAAILGDVLSFSLAQQPNVIEDVMQVRMAIECQAIRLACAVATEADLAEISRRLEVFVDSLQDPDRGGRADHAFHLALVEASDSLSLITVYRTLEPLLVRSHVNRRQLVAADLSVTSSLVQAHKDILVAMMKGDPDEAERCLRGHFAIGGIVASGPVGQMKDREVSFGRVRAHVASAPFRYCVQQLSHSGTTQSDVVSHKPHASSQGPGWPRPFGSLKRQQSV